MEYPSRARRLAWTSALAFMAVEGVIRALDLYRRAPWVDLPSHFLSGAAVTAILCVFLAGLGPGRRARSAMIGNAAVALAWEAAEAIDEVFTPDPPHLQDVFFWDGFWDVSLALVGGLVVLRILRSEPPP
ncbi:MAG: hypothetical protein OEO23_04200 [Gemmatimonadota bacterium]|nr:hypothetical protein [Gemmatimonadota bacterium]